MTGRHTRSIPIVQSDSDRVIRLLAGMVDALRCEQQLVGYVRTDAEVERDVQEVIDDAWGEVRKDG